MDIVTAITVMQVTIIIFTVPEFFASPISYTSSI